MPKGGRLKAGCGARIARPQARLAGHSSGRRHDNDSDRLVSLSSLTWKSIELPPIAVIEDKLLLSPLLSG